MTRSSSPAPGENFVDSSISAVWLVGAGGPDFEGCNRLLAWIATNDRFTLDQAMEGAGLGPDDRGLRQTIGRMLTGGRWVKTRPQWAKGRWVYTHRL